MFHPRLRKSLAIWSGGGLHYQIITSRDSFQSKIGSAAVQIFIKYFTLVGNIADGKYCSQEILLKGNIAVWRYSFFEILLFGDIASCLEILLFGDIADGDIVGNIADEH